MSTTRLDLVEAIRNLPSIKRARLRQLLMDKGVDLSTIPIVERPSDLHVIPATFAQERLWFLHQLDRSSTAYNVPEAARMIGALNVDALRRALNEVVRRHDSLRTTFSSVDGTPIQVIAPSLVLELSQTDLTPLDASARAQQCEFVIQQEAETTFDLASGPLLKARLLRLTPTEHVLLLTAHHIVVDGASIELLAGEMMALYEAYAQGKTLTLPELPLQYGDYAYWQRHWLSDDAVQHHVDYWVRQLAGAPLLALPTDRPRLGAPQRHGATIVLKLSVRLAQQIHALARQTHTTPFMVLAAAFNVLLWRHSRQDDICIGTAMSGRSRAELEPLIGLFATTLVLRTRLQATATFMDLLHQVKATTLEAHAHQDAPFERLLQVLNPTRDARYSPLFQVMLVLQDAKTPMTPGAGPSARWVRHGVTQSKFDLTVHVIDEAEGIEATFEYDANIFDDSTVERMAKHFEQLLQDATTSPSTAIGRLQMVTEPERWRILNAFNDTAADFPRELCIHQLFEQQAARTPDATALVFEDASLSYRELNALANRLAHHLIAMGVRPDALVAIALPRSIDMVVALLATLKAGGAYVPLDPDYPCERLAFMLADSAPRVLITDASVQALLGAVPDSVAVLPLDVDSSWLDLPPDNPDPAALSLSASHLAYVIYTSGSTGRPKGVLIEHRQVSRLFDATRSWFNFGSRDVWTLCHSYAFDFSVWELWGALLHGGRLVLVSRQTARSPLDFYNLLCAQRVTVLNQTPSAFRQLITAQAESGNAHDLRLVIFGGEALVPSSLAPWYSRNGARTQLVNMYGITETTVHVTYHPLTEADTHDTGSPIGVRIPDLRLLLLDPHGQLTPIGVPGELCISGAGVARGYLGRPDLTAERFVPDPFGEPGSRMYLSGDLGRWRPDGSIEFLGRNDHQVKLRGFRIELGEIEAALRAHPSVREAVVIAEDVPGHQRLVAYVVGDMGEAAPEALRAHLGGLLPEYMVPAAYVPLDALPLTPNGKLDRKALPAPDAEAFDARAYEAPVGQIESLLAALWGELLGLERIGRHDDFFALGGHSLLAVQLTSRVRAALGLDVPLSELFAQPTLAGFAERVAAATASALPAVVPASRHEALPLSFAQQRLWFLAQLDERATAAYAIPGGVRLKGSLDRAALYAALNRIVARHEALRTSFTLVDGAPVQVMAPPEMGLALSHLDLSSHANPEAELERLVAEEATAPFDLAHGPLIRGQLIRLADYDHALLVTMHHIVSDGWSMGVLVNEFSAFYAAYVQGEPDQLPPLPIQYADYAVWQRRWLAGEVLQRQLDFWRDHLRGAPSLLELPTDRPRPGVQDYAGSSVHFKLDETLSAALTALGRRHGTTLFMTLLAGWAALLSRLSGQGDVVIGTPVANRHRAEIEPLIGFFVNTQALRIDLSGSPTVAQLLGQVRATALAAQDHQDIPFEHVVEALSPARSMAHAPLFQVWFDWQNQPGGTLELPGLHLQGLEAPGSTVQFDLMLSMQDTGEGIAGSMQYACALFDAATIERYVGHWRTLLCAMAADDGQSVARLPLLSSSARDELLDGWNETQTPFPSLCAHELFEQQVARTPQAAAVVYGGASLSYAELNEQANRLAHRLVASGVRPDTRVALALPRSLDMAVAVLATLKAGGAYVPLDPDYPAERLAFMLDDCRPRVVLTHAAVQERLPASRALLTATVLELDDPSSWADQPTHNPLPAALGLGPKHLAYVIYTSGSTGRPKGVMVEHAGLVNYLHWALEAYGPAGGSVVSSSLSFDATVTSLYLPLLTGGCVTLLPEDGEIEALQALLAGPRGTGLVKITPAHLEVLGRQLQAQALPCSAEVFVIGGEALPAPVVRLWHELAPHVRLVNEYGPTETVVGCVVQELAPDAPVPDRVPIGRPIANTRIYLLDAQGEPVPVGVVGEVHISSPGVARGYLNRPDLTAERFVPDPFGEPGSRMYKTGDLGRWREDRRIEYLGRNDHQVKVRGFRIELGEIEAALRSHPDVRVAVALAREDVPGDKRLVAYVIGEVAPEVLRQHLASRLPEHMVPAAYVPLDALPLTPNGKLDRRALPAPEANAYGAHAYEAPQGEVETLLADLWSELLKIERIGRRDDFFALGGHSLLAVQLTSRIRARLGLDVSLAELFAQPTVAGFAQRVASAHASILPAVVPVSRQEAPPLSYAQQRLWFLAQLDERAGAAYAIPGGMRLKGSLDAPALHAALNRIAARHEALRTCFSSVDGAPVQLIAPSEMGVSMSQADLSGHRDPEAELQRLASEEAQASFDLARGPLIRARLIRLADDDHALLVTMHHIVSDGWSMGVLIHELSALYAAYSQRQPDPLPPLPIQYADYALWQRRWITGEVLQRQLHFWRDHLGGAPALLALPTDRPRPPAQDYIGASVDVELDKELTTALKALSRRHGTTLFMTLLAGWAALLARLSGQGDVVIGTPVANRHRAELEPLIGFFVNTLALRVNLAARPTVAELLAQVRATALAAQAHQDVPFEQVVETLQPARSMAHSPVFQVMFAWHNTRAESLHVDGLHIEPLTPQGATAKFDLVLSLEEHGSVIGGSIQYATSLFDAATVKRHVEHWQVLLRAMAGDDAQFVDQLPVLTETQRRQVLYDWNATHDTPPQVCAHHLFEAQVQRTPQAVALVHNGESLTYAQLNERANQLAHVLIAHGVGPDVPVAIGLPRSFDMAVSVLAVLKAGGAYLPIDLGYPAQRMAYMLEDAAPPVLLTHAGLHRLWDALPPATHIVDVERIDGGSALDPEVRVTPDHLAFVMYTSGSTGRPKGVGMPHRPLVNLIAWHLRTQPGARRTLQYAALGFDASFHEMFTAWGAGGELTLLDEATRLDPGLLAALVSERRIERLFLPYVALKALAAQCQAAGDLELGSVREVITAGEQLVITPEIESLFAMRLPQASLHNHYGPTETHVASAYELPADVRQWTHLPPIGRPIANTRFYVLDTHRNPVPVGVPGEIYIAGLCVARGYLNHEALTAERFMADPFVPGSADEPHPRMYKTGDLGRWRADGMVEYLGRGDEQVKIRGFRVEPGEIEAQLASCAGVRQAAVIAREDEPGHRRLVAYYVADDDASAAVDARALRKHLETCLPEYMVPVAYVRMERFPLSPNGKLARTALPSPDAVDYASPAYEPPEGEIEQIVAQIWVELLGVERVGREDDFFKLGGHSLVAVQLVSRIKDRLMVDVPLQDVFAEPRLRSVASKVLSRIDATLSELVSSSDEFDTSTVDMN